MVANRKYDNSESMERAEKSSWIFRIPWPLHKASNILRWLPCSGWPKANRSF